jgi:hypothetical protein
MREACVVRQRVVGRVGVRGFQSLARDHVGEPWHAGGAGGEVEDAEPKADPEDGVPRCRFEPEVASRDLTAANSVASSRWAPAPSPPRVSRRPRLTRGCKASFAVAASKGRRGGRPRPAANSTQTIAPRCPGTPQAPGEVGQAAVAHDECGQVVRLGRPHQGLAGAPGRRLGQVADPGDAGVQRTAPGPRAGDQREPGCHRIQEGRRCGVPRHSRSDGVGAGRVDLGWPHGLLAPRVWCRRPG